MRSKVGPGGRVVIPAAFREAAGMNEGADVMIVLDGHQIRLVTPMADFVLDASVVLAHLNNEQGGDLALLPFLDTI